MKRLTINQVAKANIRVNRKAYTSLFLGILTAVFLATATSLCTWGTVRGHEEQMAERAGWMDMILLGNDGPTDDQLRNSGFFREIGHVTVNAAVEGTGICAGYYDDTAAELINRTLKEGRLPEKAGEIAAERSALIRLGQEKAAPGDTLTLAMEPVGGVSEEKSFTLVGILNEQSEYLDTGEESAVMRLPAILVFPGETYAVGSAVVHRVVTYAPLITYNQVERNCPVYLGQAYGVSRESGGITYYDSGWERAARIVERVLIWAVLGAALMLCACVGITMAMESILGRKTEDIGMMRAIGATRRQIRRIYGAEAWLLALTALPAGLLAGIAVFWIISRIAPDLVVFSLNIWLLVPILALSALCVFAASLMPLYHASAQMPMGVLRDTAMLRKAGRLRSHRVFDPGTLIAGRRVRLHPLRQTGAAGMVALTLFSMLMLGEIALGMNLGEDSSSPDYQLCGPGAAYTGESFSVQIPEEGLSGNDLRRIAAVPGVETVRNTWELTASLLEDEVPEYFRPAVFHSKERDGTGEIVTSIGPLEGNWPGSGWLFYTEEDLADARARREEDWSADLAVQTISQMNLIRAQLGLTETLVPVRLYVADLDEETLREYVVDGSVDMDRLDSGEQALVYAPAICAKRHEEGGFAVERWLYPKEIRESDWDLVIRNDAFSAGMPLKLLEMAGKTESTEENEEFWKTYYPSLEAVRADVTVGAVLSGPTRINEYSMYSFAVILSRKGAEALGLILPGPDFTDIYLAGNPTPEEEEEITDRISQIATSTWTAMENRLELSREYEVKKLRQILLFAGLLLLFFTVSVFMQVSGTARQIRAETRTIGTLRAVGANLKTLVSCYRLPVWISAAAAMVPCLLFYGVTEIPGLRLFTENHPLVMIPALALLAACVALACIAGIRGRLAAVTRQSIVDNIREL